MKERCSEHEMVVRKQAGTMATAPLELSVKYRIVRTKSRCRLRAVASRRAGHT